MNILSWDIEASNLNADFGIMLCCGFKVVGQGSPKVLRIDDFPGSNIIKKEKAPLRAVRARLLEADCWLTHFGTWYDIPFVNTRLLYHNLPTLPTNFPHVDTWKISKNHLKLRNNRLITISEFLGTRDEKNAIKPEQWLLALGGHRSSMSYIVEHCRRDVLVLEQAYGKLRHLINNHPVFNLVSEKGVCKTCGSSDLQWRGYHRTRQHAYRRFHCQDCGQWDHDRKALKGVA